MVEPLIHNLVNYLSMTLKNIFVQISSLFEEVIGVFLKHLYISKKKEFVHIEKEGRCMHMNLLTVMLFKMAPEAYVLDNVHRLLDACTSFPWTAAIAKRPDQLAVVDIYQVMYIVIVYYGFNSKCTELNYTYIFAHRAPNIPRPFSQASKMSDEENWAVPQNRRPQSLHRKGWCCFHRPHRTELRHVIFRNYTNNAITIITTTYTR